MGPTKKGLGFWGKNKKKYTKNTNGATWRIKHVLNLKSNK